MTNKRLEIELEMASWRPGRSELPFVVHGPKMYITLLEFWGGNGQFAIWLTLVDEDSYERKYLFLMTEKDWATRVSRSEFKRRKVIVQR